MRRLSCRYTSYSRPLYTRLLSEVYISKHRATLGVPDSWLKAAGEKMRQHNHARTMSTCQVPQTISRDVAELRGADIAPFLQPWNMDVFADAGHPSNVGEVPDRS